MDVNELRRKRVKAIADARAVQDAAEKEDRDLTAEEETTRTKFIDEVKSLGARVARQEELDEEERKAAGGAAGSGDGRGGSGARGGDGGDDPQRDQRTAPAYTGRALQTAKREDVEARWLKSDQRAAVSQFARGGLGALNEVEQRALQADVDASGGYITVPQEMSASLIKAVDDLVFVRQVATVQTLDRAESLGVASLDADPADADWTTELQTGGEDSTMAFGKRELRPHPVGKLIKVSNTLLRRAAMDAEALVRDRLAYKFGVTHEKGFLTGSGAQQPLGVFTASAQGISTARDVSTGNLTTSIQTDGLQEAKWTLKPQYRLKARWMFHSDALKQIAKLKDGDGQYIWQAGIQAGAPDRLLNLPYMESRYAPNTFTTNLYVGLLGDWSFYWIVDALDMTIQRLVELYAATNQVGFIGRMESDGMPVLEEAFVRVKLA